MLDQTNTKYKVPNFITLSLNKLDANDELTLTIKKFINNVKVSIENGESLFINIKNKKFNINLNGNILSVPLFTKKQCHLFLTASETNLKPDQFITAILYSWIISNGGSVKLVNCLIKELTFQVGLFIESRQKIQYNIIQWLCKIENQIDLVNFETIPISDYLLHKFKNDPNYSLKGRTFNSVLKQTEVWHKQLKISQFKEYPQIWEPLVIIKSFNNSDYSITEILNIQELYEEGKELSHCVLSYIKNISLFKTSIWSFKQNNKRLLTIEVNSQKQILQIRGYKNRRPTLQELLILGGWFEKEGLIKTEGNINGF